MKSKHRILNPGMACKFRQAFYIFLKQDLYLSIFLTENHLKVGFPKRKYTHGQMKKRIKGVLKSFLCQSLVILFICFITSSMICSFSVLLFNFEMLSLCDICHNTFSISRMLIVLILTSSIENRLMSDL